MSQIFNQKIPQFITFTVNDDNVPTSAVRRRTKFRFLGIAASATTAQRLVVVAVDPDRFSRPRRASERALIDVEVGRDFAQRDVWLASLGKVFFATLFVVVVLRSLSGEDLGLDLGAAKIGGANINRTHPDTMPCSV